MYLVFLTGGLAAGKGRVRAYLEERGAQTVDLDTLAKEEQEQPAVLAELAAAFGSDIVKTDGRLNRPLLSERAFSSPEATARLNAICWPPVLRRLEALLAAAWETEAGEAQEVAAPPFSTTGLVLIEVPLLAESGALLDEADEVLAVAASEELRLARACGRGMSKEDACRRLQRQASDEERAAISDTVFTNEGTLAELYSQVQAWYDRRVGEGRF
jgi:dephospho-CoA kinase